MTDFLRALGTNLVERLIVALLAAVITTYILTAKQDVRIAQLEKESAKLEAESDVRFNEQRVRNTACEQKLEHIGTLLELHMQQSNELLKGAKR